MDFYSPSFKGRFLDWVNSIEKFPKPYDMTFGRLPELFDVNVDKLFNEGNPKGGCLSDSLKTDSDGRKYFNDKRFAKDEKNKTIVITKKVICKYGSSRKKFMEDFKARRLALERAITIFMAEGPFSTSSFELPGGEKGCELETLDYVSKTVKRAKSWPDWDSMLTNEFTIVFRLPHSLGIMKADQELSIKFDDGYWYTKVPGYHYTIDNMCSTPHGLDATNRVCVAKMAMVYFPKHGMFKFDEEYYKNLDTYEAKVIKEIGFNFVAKAESSDILKSLEENKLGEVPCHIKWSNSHRLDPASNTSCIHFAAASKGDIYVVFSSIPKDHSTWYYLQISPEGVSFYSGMVLRKRDVSRSSGTLGDDNLFETFFVCVHQAEDKNIGLSFGKAPSGREVGVVLANYQFPLTRKDKVSFYTFGSGEDKVTVDDVRVIRGRPEEVHCSGNLVRRGHQCVMECDPQCLTCHQPNDPKSCSGPCRNVKHFYEADKSICLAECPPGYEKQQEDGQDICRPCKPGFHKEDAGNQMCSKCEPGTFAENEGMKVCNKCPVGHFQDKMGGTSCSSCNPGTFQNLKGQRGCVQCNSGRYQDEKGQPSCKECPPGQYQNLKGKSTCNPCPIGRFQPFPGKTECKPCKIGSIATKVGRSKCDLCPVGHMCPSADVTKPCSKNTYQDKRGQIECMDCPGDQRSEPASASCGLNVCRKGQYLDQQVCRLCAEGYIAPANGLTECTKCTTRGFTSNKERTKCVDVDECSHLNGLCNQNCINVEGSFKCSCNQGYKLHSDGKNCKEVNECFHDNGGCDQICKNLEGSHKCSCRKGYELTHGTSCKDVNECSNKNGGCEHICNNSEGSFNCTCKRGYKLHSDKKTCKVISCEKGYEFRKEMTCKAKLTNVVTHGRCDSPTTEAECEKGSFPDPSYKYQYSGTFANSPPGCYVYTSSYHTAKYRNKVYFNKGGGGDCLLNPQCLCKPKDVVECLENNKLIKEGKLCKDADECMTNNGGCQHNCTNTVGSYNCSCASGYQLKEDGKSCKDVDECSQKNGGCYEICTNTKGSHKCSCRVKGFKLNKDGKSCSLGHIPLKRLENGRCEKLASKEECAKHARDLYGYWYPEQGKASWNSAAKGCVDKYNYVIHRTEALFNSNEKDVRCSLVIPCYCADTRLFVKVLSTKHSSGAVGKYFGFKRASIPGLGTDLHKPLTFKAMNSRTGQTGEVKVWGQAPSGVSIEGVDAHGRFNSNPVDPALNQWLEGDYLVVNGKYKDGKLVGIKGAVTVSQTKTPTTSSSRTRTSRRSNSRRKYSSGSNPRSKYWKNLSKRFRN